MTKAGIPVPPGFTIIADACEVYEAYGKKLPPELKKLVDENMA